MPIRIERRAAANVFLATALAFAWGCANEERGPLLLGGRELKSWLKDLNNLKPTVRRQAVLKLGNAAEANPAVAEGLAGSLKDKDATVRREAILAVVKLKAPGSEIMERLQFMSRNDRDVKVRDAASKAASHLSENN